MTTSKRVGIDWDQTLDTLDNVYYRQQTEQSSYEGTFSMEKAIAIQGHPGSCNASSRMSFRRSDVSV